MSEEKQLSHTTANQRADGQQAAGKKTDVKFLLAIFLVFVGAVTVVFLTQKRGSIQWVTDYEAGLKLAREQNKPLLLAFYKENTHFCSLMHENTYSNPGVAKYIEKNFVAILIDVDKQPELAQQFKVNYYPTHYIKAPDGDKLFGPRLGYDPPELFIREIERLRKKLNLRTSL